MEPDTREQAGNYKLHGRKGWRDTEFSDTRGKRRRM